MGQKIKWKIDRVESFWYFSGRYEKTYSEITYWYDPISLIRRETQRTYSTEYTHGLPDWCKSIQTRNKNLEDGTF